LKIELVSDDNKSFFFEVPSDISLGQFKSFILNKTKNPFYFDFKIDHDLKIDELLKLSLTQTLNITFNPNSLNLCINDTFGSYNLIIKGLT
jgi:hypothetical protein